MPAAAHSVPNVFSEVYVNLSPSNRRCYRSDPSFTLLLAARAGPSLRGNSMTTRELKTHDSNQEKNDFMATTPEADSSAAWPCPGKLSKGPACSAASGWGLSCEGLALHQARAEGQVAECGTTRICHNLALPAPRASQRFHEWSHFPGSGLAEPLAARPNHHQPPPGLRVGPEQFCSCEWRRALPPRRARGRGGGLYLYLFLNSMHSSSEEELCRSESWLQFRTIAVGLPVAAGIGA